MNMNFKSGLKKRLKILRNCFILLSKDEIKKLRLVAVGQLALAFLELLGVMAFGALGALTVLGIQSRAPEGYLAQILNVLGIADASLQSQVSLIGILAGLALVFKTLASAMINRGTLYFLSRRSAEISARIIEKLTFSNFEQIRRRTRFENIQALTGGVQSITLGVIGTFSNLLADFFLIAVMFSGLLLIDPTIAFSTVLMFSMIAFILYSRVNKEISRLVKLEMEIGIKTNRLLYDLFGSYREIFAGGLRDRYAHRVAELRRRGSNVSAAAAFLPNVSKYVLEIAFVAGAIFFVGLQFVLKDAAGAIASISIFLVATGRTIPAILRIQLAALTVRGALGGAQIALELIEELKEFDSPLSNNSNSKRHEFHFKGTVEANSLSFKYQGHGKNVISDIDLYIPEGEWLAIVGPSGSGKTTLVDLLLGILKPSQGFAKLSGLESEQALSSFPGSVSYVAQDSFIFEGSIEENITLNRQDLVANIERVRECLSLVGLEKFLDEKEAGLQEQVGELGSKLSGGQRQRLGIARALYTAPKILILDEATSALDANSEKVITDCLNVIRGKTTIISIAHRLSTVINADRLIYLESGRIVASGNFEEVRLKVPDFNRQVELSSLEDVK